MDLKKSLTLAVRPSIVLRGLKFSLVVGTLLVLINHGDRLFTEGVTLTQALQIALTYAVPYAVSSLSSIQAMLSRDDEAEA